MSVAVVGLVALALLTGWLLLRGSLPKLDGEIGLPGLQATVMVERDALGIPTIRGESRLDLARATGFVHAQDRFFQMDLRRRFAAGELAALFGEAALGVDERARLHRFRARAGEAVGRIPPDDRALMEAYAAGVNAALEGLRARPFEYLALRAHPAPWRPEDCLLAAWSMFMDLQPDKGGRDLTREAMRRALSPELYAFLTDNGSAWESTLDGTSRPIRPVPGPEHFAFLAASRLAGGGRLVDPAWPGVLARRETMAERDVPRGSNTWAVSGALSTRGSGALVANDMHLSLRDLPPVWYRARIVQQAAGVVSLDVTGVTFPGVHLMVAGSNGHVAWGFTNANADVTDVFIVEPDESRPDHYLTPDGPRPIGRHEEVIAVRGGKSRSVWVEETIWGPLLPEGGRSDSRRLALAWVAHDTSRVNLDAIGLESARTVEEALETARNAWFPAQNVLVGDAAGNIAWTLMGMVPRRVGWDGSVPTSMVDERACWAGMIDDAPVIVNPESGRLWTANARVVGGAFGRALGDGGHDDDGRAFQIGARLRAADEFDEQALFAIQKDCETFFLRRWRDLMLELLDEEAVRATGGRDRLRAELEAWTGEAEVDSHAHGKIREFRERTAIRVFARLLRPAQAEGAAVDHRAFNYEEPLWLLVSGRQPWTTRTEGGWKAELLAILDEVAGSDRNWGEINRIDMCHPLARSIPALRRWLGVERTPVSGDKYAPNALFRRHGPSERFVVAPGREEAGIMHLPGGQSGHPLSRYFRAGHEAWLKGQATPFLPGEAVHRLRLVP